MIKKYTWEFDESEEYWQNGTFDTIEECIRDAKECMKDNYTGKHDVIYVGETIAFEPWVLGPDVIEHLEQQAFDECGEAAEGWDVWNKLRQKGNEQKDAAWNELSQQLTDVVNRWLEKHGLIPDFYNIVNIREVALDGTVQSKKE